MLERARPLCQNGTAFSTRFGRGPVSKRPRGDRTEPVRGESVESKALHRTARGAFLPRQRHARGVSREDRAAAFRGRRSGAFPVHGDGRARESRSPRSTYPRSGPRGFACFAKRLPRWNISWDGRTGSSRGTSPIFRPTCGTSPRSSFPSRFCRSRFSPRGSGRVSERGSSPRSFSRPRSRSSRGRADSIISGRTSPCRSSPFTCSSTSRRAREAASRRRSSRAFFFSRRSRHGTGRNSISRRSRVRPSSGDPRRCDPPRTPRGALPRMLDRGRRRDRAVPPGGPLSALDPGGARRGRPRGRSPGAPDPRPRARGARGRKAQPDGANPRAAKAAIAALAVAAVILPGGPFGRGTSPPTRISSISCSYKLQIPQEAGRSAAPSVRRTGLLGRAVQLPRRAPLLRVRAADRCFSCRVPCRSSPGGPGGANPRRSSSLAFLAVFFFLFLLMQRLLPLFGFFAAVAAGGNVPLFPAGPESAEIREPRVLRLDRRPRDLSASRISAGRGGAITGGGSRGRSRCLRARGFTIYPGAKDVEGDLLAWVRGNVEPDAVVMSLHYLSPQVLAYTGRATNLNDFFESPRLQTQGRAAARVAVLERGGSVSGSARSNRATISS